MKTKATKQSDIIRHWHLIDVKGKVLGRITGEIAGLLRGKTKPYFVPHLDCGDYVVVINAAKVVVTAEKETQKTYTRYSGYPGGLKKETLAQLRARKPEGIIKHAVSGMLPTNKLRDRWLSRLFIYPDGKHPYENKFNAK